NRWPQRVVALVVLLTMLFAAVPVASAQTTDPRFFEPTGYRISNDAFWDYFQKRGGIQTFGYPVSRTVQLFGKPTQFFQRRIIQLNPDGSVGQLNLLDPEIMPYTNINFAQFPAADPALVQSAPAVGSPNYDLAVLGFVQANAPNTFQGMPTGFARTFNSTVTMPVAFPTGGGNAGLLQGINLEMWGVPTSRPALDPNNNNFAYQRFQRGIMHFDQNSGLTQGLLLADYLKSIMTGQNLPPDLADAAKGSRFFAQYNNANPQGLNRPDDLFGSDFKDGFEREQPQAAPGPPPPPVAGGFRYGLQAHMFDVDRNQIYNATRDIGFSWLKQQIEWKLWEPSPGDRQWGAMDAIVDSARANGITMLFSVVGAPGWAREPGYDASVAGPPQNPQTFADSLGAMAGRYCNRGLGAIEVWNEQNLHYEWGNRPISPAEYMAMLRPAYASIKAACPSMIVVAGALTPTGAPAPLAMDDFAYLQGMYDNGLRAVSDAIGMHPSGFNVPPSLNHTQACGYLQQKNASFRGPCDNQHHSWSFRSTVDGYRAIMVSHGDSNKQLWATEFGWAVRPAFDANYGYANDNSPEEQAAWTVEAYNYMRQSGFVGAAFLWNLNFRVVADGTEKAQWGIVTNTWQPLPAYNALKAMPK
ncbi:MAG TPA: hypothetical protein VMP10_02975, partial [Chloroflexota bacterium]|nr:hypothetical protein [Chloroflexota bacterium]